MPELAAQSYHKKLEKIKKKIETLEQSWKGDEKDIIMNISDRRKQLISIKLFQKQKKKYQLEYRAILRNLSVMLIAVQNSQF